MGYAGSDQPPAWTRKALPPDAIIGYEYIDEEDEVHMFVCAYHESNEYWADEGWTPITVLNTYSNYYRCDRLGCEMGYYKEPCIGKTMRSFTAEGGEQVSGTP